MDNMGQQGPVQSESASVMRTYTSADKQRQQEGVRELARVGSIAIMRLNLQQVMAFLLLPEI